jgi:hypothetical protein
MGLFGKILAILNALAALAFLALAAMDYGARHAWEFAILNQQFLVRGLPVDDKEKNADGQVLKDLIGKETKSRLGLGNEVTQAEMARSRHDQLKSELDGLNGAAKEKRLEDVVLPLAQNAIERANVRQLIKNPNKHNDLLGENGPFERAYADTQDAKLAYGLRRQAIAHFLFNTSSEKKDYDQTLTTVGLQQYADQVNAEAGALARMTPDVEKAIDAERTEFANKQRALIQQILVLNDQLDELKADLTKNQDKYAKFDSLVALRKQDKADLLSQIESARQAAEAALAVQTDLEKAVFDAQKEVEKRNLENQKLEGTIKTRELGERGK